MKIKSQKVNVFKNISLIRLLSLSSTKFIKQKSLMFNILIKRLYFPSECRINVFSLNLFHEKKTTLSNYFN